MGTISPFLFKCCIVWTNVANKNLAAFFQVSFEIFVLDVLDRARRTEVPNVAVLVNPSGLGLHQVVALQLHHWLLHGLIRLHTVNRTTCAIPELVRPIFDAVVQVEVINVDKICKRNFRLVSLCAWEVYSSN